MNTEFISREEIEEVQNENKCGVRVALDLIAPWAAKKARVEGGYYAFASLSDWETWKNQK
jgi:hypothetical protein